MKFHGLEIRLDKHLKRIIQLGKLLVIILVLGEVFFGWGESLKNGLQQGLARQCFFWQQEPQLNLLSAWFWDGLLLVIGLPTLMLLGAIFAGCLGWMGIRGENRRFIGSYLKRAGLRLNLSNLEQMVANLLLVGLILLLPQLLIAPYSAFPRDLVYSLLWSFMGYCLLMEAYFLAGHWYSRRRIVREVDERLGLKEALLTCIQGSQQGQNKLQDYLNHQVIQHMKEQSTTKLFPCRPPRFSGNHLLRQLFLISFTALFFSVLLAPLVSSYVWKSPVVDTGTPQPELLALAQELWQEGEEISKAATELEYLTQNKEEGLAAAAAELKQLGNELAMLSTRSLQPLKPRGMVPGNQSRLALSEKEAQQFKKQILSRRAAKHEIEPAGEALASAEEVKTPLDTSSPSNPQLQAAAWQQLKTALSHGELPSGEGVEAEEGQDFSQILPASTGFSSADTGSLNRIESPSRELAARSNQSEQTVPKGQAPTSSPGKEAKNPSAPNSPPLKQEVSTITQGQKLQKILEELDKWQQELTQHLTEIKEKENRQDYLFEGMEGEFPRQATVIKGHQNHQEQPDTEKGKIRLSGQPQEDPHHQKVVNLDPNNKEPLHPLLPDSKRTAVVAQVNLEGFSPNQPALQMDAGKKQAGEGETHKEMGLKPDERELSGDRQLPFEKVLTAGGDDLRGNEPADNPDSEPQYELEKKLLTSNSIPPSDPEQPAATSNLKTIPAETTAQAETPGARQGDGQMEDKNPEPAMVNLHSTKNSIQELANSQLDRPGIKGLLSASPPENSLLYSQFNKQAAENKAKKMQRQKMLAGQEKNLGASPLMDASQGKERLSKQSSALNPELGRNNQPENGNPQLAMVNLHTIQELADFRFNKPRVEGLSSTNPPENSLLYSQFNKQTAENKGKKMQKQKMLAGQEKNLGASSLMDAGQGKEQLSEQSSALNPELGRLKSLLEEGSNGTNPRWQEVLGKAFSHIEKYQQHQAGQRASGFEGADGRKAKKAKLQQASRQLGQARKGLNKLAQEWLSPPKELLGEGQAQLQQTQEKELQQLSRQIRNLKGIFPQAEVLSSQIKDIAWQLESPTVDPPDSLPFSSKGTPIHSDKGINSGKSAAQQATYSGDSLPPEEQLRKQALKRVNQFLERMLFLLEGKQSTALLRDTSGSRDLSSASSRRDREGRPQNPDPAVSNEYLFPGESASKEGQSAQPLYLDERLAEAGKFSPTLPDTAFNEELERLNQYRRELQQPTPQRLSKQRLQQKIEDQASVSKARGKPAQDDWPASRSAGFGLPPNQKRSPPKDKVRGAYPKQENLSRQDVFAKVVQRLRRVRQHLAHTETASLETVRPAVSALKRSRPEVQKRRNEQRPVKQPLQAAASSERWKLTPYELAHPSQKRKRVKKKSAIPANTLIYFAPRGNTASWLAVPVSEGSNSRLDFSASLPGTPQTETALNPMAEAADPVGEQPLPHFYQPIIRQLFQR